MKVPKCTQKERFFQFEIDVVLCCMFVDFFSSFCSGVCWVHVRHTNFVNESALGCAYVCVTHRMSMCSERWSARTTFFGSSVEYSASFASFRFINITKPIPRQFSAQHTPVFCIYLHTYYTDTHTDLASERHGRIVYSESVCGKTRTTTSILMLRSMYEEPQLAIVCIGFCVSEQRERKITPFLIYFQF